MSKAPVIGIIGGGAAAIFASIFAAQAAPSARVVVLEKSNQFLSKVRISGGGRCNVTHACFDPRLLVQNYPRGGKALLGPFSRFQPKDTMAWFESQGVGLKIEADGRVFPQTDDSGTIVNALLAQAHAHGIELCQRASVEAILPQDGKLLLTLAKEEQIACDRLLLATGSNTKMWDVIHALGHQIVPPLPSLFTFNIPKDPLLEISGVSVADVHVKIKALQLEQRGPLLITHWGFSGPAILKLSAWGARLLHAENYRVDIHINWVPQFTAEDVWQKLLQTKAQYPARLLQNELPVPLPKNLWKKLCDRAGCKEMRWSEISHALLQHLNEELRNGCFAVQGKSTYKEEFVTCGGVQLADVDFKTMQSKRCQHVYFAGEVLDIDGITGGFNFQNAWTTAWIAAHAMAASL